MTIEYHNGKLAINVKDHRIYAQDPPFEIYSQKDLQTAYEDCKEAFWTHYAPKVAEKYGYGKVFSEGRSGGWLVVEKSPRLRLQDYLNDEQSPTLHKHIANEQTKWLDFSREILAEMSYCYNDRLIELLKEMTYYSQKAATAYYKQIAIQPHIIGGRGDDEE